jgi:hypothetical protein
MSYDCSKDIIQDICLKYTDGVTMLNGDGVWKNSDNLLTKESSIICVIYNLNKSDITPMLNEIAERLNQESILVDEKKVKLNYYV